MFTWMQKSIEFHLLHYEIPQLSSRYLEHIGDTFGWKDRQKTNEYSVDTSLE